MPDVPDVPEAGAADLDDEAGTGELTTRVVKVKDRAQDIGSFIRAQREAAQVSLRQLALLAGVSNPYLSQIERGLRNPSAEVLSQIARGLRVSSEALYVRAGYLEQRPNSPVRDALLADVLISERQKQVLLEIYESFCRENGAEAEKPALNPPPAAPAPVEGETTPPEPEPNEIPDEESEK